MAFLRRAAAAGHPGGIRLLFWSIPGAGGPGPRGAVRHRLPAGLPFPFSGEEPALGGFSGADRPVGGGGCPFLSGSGAGLRPHSKRGAAGIQREIRHSPALPGGGHPFPLCGGAAVHGVFLPAHLPLSVLSGVVSGGEKKLPGGLSPLWADAAVPHDNLPGPPGAVSGSTAAVLAGAAADSLHPGPPPPAFGGGRPLSRLRHHGRPARHAAHRAGGRHPVHGAGIPAVSSRRLPAAPNCRRPAGRPDAGIWNPSGPAGRRGQRQRPGKPGRPGNPQLHGGNGAAGEI